MTTMTMCDDRVTRLTASDGPPVFLDHDDLVARMAAKAAAIDGAASDRRGDRFRQFSAERVFVNRRAVWAAVSADPRVTLREIARQTGLASETVQNHLQSLVDLGYLTRLAKNWYRVDMPLIDAPHP